MHNRKLIADYLVRLQSDLINASLWQETLPSIEALSSRLPFCCDTLTLEQWLQFVFIPKMSSMLNNNLPLPSVISIIPIAEDAFRDNSQAHVILATLSKLEQLLSEQ